MVHFCQYIRTQCIFFKTDLSVETLDLGRSFWVGWSISSGIKKVKKKSWSGPNENLKYFPYQMSEHQMVQFSLLPLISFHENIFLPKFDMSQCTKHKCTHVHVRFYVFRTHPPICVYEASRIISGWSIDIFWVRCSIIMTFV